jgi:hypothetical protein
LKPPTLNDKGKMTDEQRKRISAARRTAYIYAKAIASRQNPKAAILECLQEYPDWCRRDVLERYEREYGMSFTDKEKPPEKPGDPQPFYKAKHREPEPEPAPEPDDYESRWRRAPEVTDELRKGQALVRTNGHDAQAAQDQTRGVRLNNLISKQGTCIIHAWDAASGGWQLKTQIPGFFDDLRPALELLLDSMKADSPNASFKVDEVITARFEVLKR